MSLTLVTAPAVEPVSLADLKLQLGLDPIEDDDPLKAGILARTLRRLITAARTECEGITRTAYITQTWKLTLRHWPHRAIEYVRHHPREILLPRPPLQAVTSFTYAAMDGTRQSLTTDDYQVDAGGGTQPAVIAPLYSVPWPLVLPGQLNGIEIDFTCGYGDTPESVPPTIQQAILFLAQFYYENGAVTDLPVPRIVGNLLNRETNWSS